MIQFKAFSLRRTLWRPYIKNRKASSELKDGCFPRAVSGRMRVDAAFSDLCAESWGKCCWFVEAEAWRRAQRARVGPRRQVVQPVAGQLLARQIQASSCTLQFSLVWQAAAVRVDVDNLASSARRKSVTRLGSGGGVWWWTPGVSVVARYCPTGPLLSPPLPSLFLFLPLSPPPPHPTVSSSTPVGPQARANSLTQELGPNTGQQCHSA